MLEVGADTRIIRIMSAAPPLPAFAVPRSPDWPEARLDHLRIEPVCPITGIDDPKRLNVHHIKPFHEFPEMELVAENLITLCERGAFSCHWIFGHGARSWSDWNPTVRDDVAYIRKMLAGIIKGK